MEIKVSHQQARVPVTIFHITGDIDAASFEQLEKQTQQAIQAGSRFLLLDLAQVSFISSYGIRAISQMYNWLRDTSEDAHTLSTGLRDGTYKAHHLKLANPVPRVLDVLTTTGVDMFLEIHADIKQAVESF